MTRDPTADRRIVLGLGNTLNRDEGVGVHALAALRVRLGSDDSVELLDGGVMGMNLLPVVESASHLLVLDAVNADAPPGTVLELTAERIPLVAHLKLSQHQLSFQEVLGLAKIRGKLPAYLHLIGVQPVDMTIGVDLSPRAAAALPVVVERAVRQLTAWGILAHA